MAQFDHEKLGVYKVSIEFIAWMESLLEATDSRHKNIREQIIRASQSMPLNIAEGKNLLLRIVSMRAKLAPPDETAGD